MSKLLHKARKVIDQNSPSHIMKKQRTRQLFNRFADQLGFVYFGYVDQRDDEHRLLRGITMSRTHSDHHYTVGTFENYDVAVVVRRDTLEYPDKRLKDHYWTIMTFDLHTAKDVPPFYLTHQKTKQQLLARFTQMTPLITGTHAPSGNDFSTTYTLYANMTHAVEVQTLISDYVSREIVKSFRDMSVEVSENTIYLYAPEKNPSKQLLDQMLVNGIWLAKTIDSSI